VTRAVRSIAGHVAGVLLLAWILAACTAGARHKTIAATFITANTTSAAYSAYQLAHQHDKEQDIVVAAPDKATGEADLAAYRKKRERVEGAIKALYNAIAAAVIVDDEPSVTSMLAAAMLLNQALADLGVKL